MANQAAKALPRRVLYLDAGLRGDVGHHANLCRAVALGLRQLGVEVRIFGHGQAQAALVSGATVEPLFSINPYARATGAHQAWPWSYEQVWRILRRDLEGLPDTGADDLIYAPSVEPEQVRAIADWQAGRPPDRRPWLVIDGCESGAFFAAASEGGALRVFPADTDPRGVLFQRLAERGALDAPKLVFASLDARCAAAFADVLGRPVAILPLPYDALAPLRSRAGARPVTIGVLGHQRRSKGLRLLPDIVREVLKARPDLRVLIQLVAPGDDTGGAARLRAMAPGEPRLKLVERIAGPSLWTQLVDLSDLVLCPYPWEPYSATYSAVAVEAAANGIPLVGPSETTIAELIAETGAGQVFGRYNARAIIDATLQAAERFDDLAERAHAAARAWGDQRGSRRMAQALLALPMGRGEFVQGSER